LLAHGRWFSPASSTTKTGRHDIAGILLKVALITEYLENTTELPPQVTDKLITELFFHLICELLLSE
jgi:hypothetical protein